MKFNEIKRFELCTLAYNLKEKELPMPLLELFNNTGKKNTLISHKIQTTSEHKKTYKN